MAEQWRPVPGFEGFYHVSDRGRIRGLQRTIIRRNGSPYTVRARLLRPTRHHGRPVVILARGRRGDYRWHYVDKLVQAVFGAEEPAA